MKKAARLPTTTDMQQTIANHAHQRKYDVMYVQRGKSKHKLKIIPMGIGNKGVARCGSKEVDRTMYS